MGYTELKHIYPKARKEHFCEWCNEKILKGEKHAYRSYIFDHDFNSDHMHLECENAMSRSRKEIGDEGFLGGEQKRGLSMSESEAIEDLKHQPRITSVVSHEITVTDWSKTQEAEININYAELQKGGGQCQH